MKKQIIYAAIFISFSIQAMELGTESQLKKNAQVSDDQIIQWIEKDGSVEEIKKLKKSDCDLYKNVEGYGSFLNCAVNAWRPDVVKWLLENAPAEIDFFSQKNCHGRNCLEIIQEDIKLYDHDKENEILAKVKTMRGMILKYNKDKQKS